MIEAHTERSSDDELPKAPSGIAGLDEITGGGLPRGRPTLVCGSAGCGKTLMAVEFLVRGALDHDEPGVFVTFEERPEELAANVRSLGFDLADLERRGKLLVEHIRVERSEIEETGDYDLEALFIRIGAAVDQTGAKRVVLDTIESLFSGLDNHLVLRAELRRLFRWLKDRRLTAVITCERGTGELTRHGLEEYVSDCVILLDHRVTEQTSTRRLRIVKYRGSEHGTDEYPFLIDREGMSVLPLSSLGLNHPAPADRVSSGVPALDEMLGGRGFFRGSTILISGTAGTGKSSLAGHFAQAAARRGERCLYVAFEESPDQIIRNMRSIGLDLEPWVRKGLLRIHATRPTQHGLEMHLVLLHKLIDEMAPQAVILDPVSNLAGSSSVAAIGAASAVLLRLVDLLKSRGTTALFTTLTSESVDGGNFGVSSLVDTWIQVREVELDSQRTRGLYILKSRGMKHAHDVREYVLSDEGITLLPIERLARVDA